MVRSPSEDDVPNQATKRPGGGSPKDSKPMRRILIVDDNTDSAQTLAMLLGLLGHDVHQVYDGPAAMEAALQCHPHVMFLDIGMPEMSGYEVARQIRAEPALRGVKLVALTGYSGDEYKALSMAAGFDFHLVKPVSLAIIEPILG